jgi:hypothetical protein
MLGPPAIGKIRLEGPPDKRHIEPHETNHRPRPDDIEKQAACEVKSRNDRHQDHKSFT